MRKGKIIILTKDDKSDKYFDYLCDSLKGIEIKSKPMGHIITNRYDIEINPYSTMRGYCPEIIYIEQKYLDILKLNPELYQIYEYINYKASNFSHNKNPIRVINNFKDIDLREIQGDGYALENTIKTNNTRGKRASMMIVDDAFDNLK